ncbi:copper resistance protein B precursor [Aurantiacibacter atlanticus]|uniref:Copper resistance protein B n=1 Tax=Aurantiacibacter atlanticus TaxID=1648404 RepID=A0A0H4VFP6_9SPHN|nr:copper resistance protein B [Aurantiacibacter atlanticus]AKQ41641.1 copper resistance protein B precursor [Aurantiacibacter atlanticus]
MKNLHSLLALPLLAVSVPALAQEQDHAAHQQAESESQTAQTQNAQTFGDDAQPEQGADHQMMDRPEMGCPQMDQGEMGQDKMGQGKMDCPSMDGQPMDHPQMNHGSQDGSSHAGTAASGTMDHGSMPMPGMQSGDDQADMDHSAMGHGTQTDHMPIPEGPPPPEALQGPAFAADAFVGAEEMEASRAAVTREVSGTPVFWFQGDRLEYRVRDGDDGYLWDVQGYYGGDYDKLWFKSEGEGSFGEAIETAEVQALWSRAIAPFFDFQAGVRQDFTGPERTHAVVGIQGLVPYEFEVDAAAFLSNNGDLTARIEGEIDQRITQRLILQPRAEIALSAQDIPELGIGAGIDAIEAGVRLRYEFAREFAPYIGIDQEWKLGNSRDFARSAGEDPSVTNYVIGVRFWF